jgi:hypothetical protein
MVATSVGADSDAALAQVDVGLMLRRGLVGTSGADRRALFGAVAVAAAVALDGLHVIPRSLTYLAEVVRAGGIRYAAELTEPLPGFAQTQAIWPWLDEAAKISSTVDCREDMARWLAAVATILAVRIVGRGEQLPERLGDAPLRANAP